ncbi:MAG: serine hydrolase domain-containing protein, partial [Flavobacteriia bacterium]
MNKLIKSLKKVARFVLFFSLALIVLINLFIVLSGRFYIYTGIRHTYLKGNTGPTIYDRDIFPYTTLQKSVKTEVWARTDRKYQMTEEEDHFVRSLDTKAILVFKNDTLIFEQYYDDHDVNSVSNSFSAAKTVVALLIGIAIEDGNIKSLDEPVGNYLPEFNSQGKEKITIRHLLMMASGLDWEE